MTHQPPIPAGNTPPYPLHPAPIPEEVKQRHAEEAAKAEAEAQEPEGGVSSTALVGAAVAVGAAAAVTGLLLGRRRSARAAAAPAKPKRGGGDDKSKRGAQDRSRVSSSEPYEVSYFARKHALTAAEAREIIKQAGPDRKAANALAERRKGK